MCIVGFLASAAAILIGFVPPSQFENGSDGAYVGLILAGTVLLGLLPPWLFLKFRKPGWKPPKRRWRHDRSGTRVPAPRRQHRTLYRLIGGFVVVLAIIGLITYSGKKTDEEAQQKAQQLAVEFQQAGPARARPPGHHHPVPRQRRRRGLRQPRQRARPGDPLDQMTNGADSSVAAR